MIRRAIPNMFHYLYNAQIPNNTNSIESFYGYLKDTLSIHRGLSKNNRKHLLNCTYTLNMQLEIRFF